MNARRPRKEESAMLCDRCGRVLDADEVEICEDCSGEFCPDCIHPAIHHCAGLPDEELEELYAEEA